MELWIRSQDKNALRRIYTSLYLKEDLSDYAKGNVWFVVSGGDKLGEYETKERALEVLDEIQNLLNPMLVFKNCNCTQEMLGNIKEAGACVVSDNAHIEQIQTRIYEMPKE